MVISDLFSSILAEQSKKQNNDLSMWINLTSEDLVSDLIVWASIIHEGLKKSDSEHSLFLNSIKSKTVI